MQSQTKVGATDDKSSNPLRATSVWELEDELNLPMGTLTYSIKIEQI